MVSFFFSSDDIVERFIENVIKSLRESNSKLVKCNDLICSVRNKIVFYFELSFVDIGVLTTKFLQNFKIPTQLTIKWFVDLFRCAPSESRKGGKGKAVEENLQNSHFISWMLTTLVVLHSKQEVNEIYRVFSSYHEWQFWTECWQLLLFYMWNKEVKWKFKNSHFISRQLCTECWQLCTEFWQLCTECWQLLLLYMWNKK